MWLGLRMTRPGTVFEHPPPPEIGSVDATEVEKPSNLRIWGPFGALGIIRWDVHGWIKTTAMDDLAQSCM